MSEPTGRRQFFFDATERDLLRCALEHLHERLALNKPDSYAFRKAAEFTNRRISELLDKLQELPHA